MLRSPLLPFRHNRPDPLLGVFVYVRAKESIVQEIMKLDSWCELVQVAPAGPGLDWR